MSDRQRRVSPQSTPNFICKSVNEQIRYFLYSVTLKYYPRLETLAKSLSLLELLRHKQGTSGCIGKGVIIGVGAVVHLETRNQTL
ncbi:hypothetical protein DAPPUDRAFT_246421 [Daphnia pulex]|uniref:Uncharacterized protein n=1 Tax=Daphnia pulex TaxID=6669 RepID=E9GQG5_DAPPU|nr:hypothetical protein DAPPUDRAFT_246421 [Daphnia pulex]|eukprot:EFX78341.1 hypothetical protein DAPPUDRAFT_246421 [Daphnia pulex]